jgi:hypothetical protein
LPCRIIHSPEAQVSELRINADHWNSQLQLLRAIEDKEHLPAYENSLDELKYSMAEFEKPDFKIQKISLGDKDVQMTVSSSLLAPILC